MNKLKVYFAPYKKGSESYKNLRARTNLSNIFSVKTLKPRLFARKENLVLINWGLGSIEDDVKSKCKAIINKPESVKLVSDKKAFFKKSQTLPVYLKPFFPRNMTPNNADNLDLLDLGHVGDVLGYPVVCRTILNGHSGAGIVIANNAGEMVPAELYTKYIKKKHEYRVHIFKDGGVFIQQKKRILEREDVNWQIRNLQNGFTYAEPTDPIPEETIAYLREILNSYGLDFGAIDIIYNAKDSAYYVLEINSAPGIQGSTLDFYEGEFEKMTDKILEN